MKFLVISKTKDMFYALPQEQRVELVAEAFAMIDKYRKSGKLKEVYNTPDQKSTVMIWDWASPEESSRIALENPLWAFQEVEAQQLVDFDESKKLIMEFVAERAKKK